MVATEAFLSEVLPHREALRRVARRMRRQDADDLVQETYMRALAARDRYEAGSNASAWLHRILVNAALSEHRRQSRDRRLWERVAAEPAEESVPVVSEPMPGAEELSGALARLSPAERRVIELADLHGMRYRDVALALDCPIGTVMSRLHRARRHLRRLVEGA